MNSILKPTRMKKILSLFTFALVAPLLFIASSPSGKLVNPNEGTYVVIAWNDLGMHCANKDFSNMCILPPYNNQSAHVILQGTTSSMPQVMGPSSGITVSYEIPVNTYSGSTTQTGKTNFWVYAQHIFGVTLDPNIGLTGLGLTGTMADSNNFFHAQGIPVTPYTDANLTAEDAYQLTLIKALGAGSTVLATTQSVIPVSNEINCVSSGCHGSEMGILNAHESVSGFNINDRPIFCANCHGDNALGMPNHAGIPPFSQAIHQAHGGKTNDCYKCHPGPNTQCFRDIMHTNGMVCQDCHGTVSNVGNTIASGRNPWLQEPSCGATTCHGATYAEETGKLFRQSKGHGGLFCSTCHGSPHAILPTSNDRDNVQNIALQGYSGILRKCEVCHGYIPLAPGPHGYNPLGIKPVSSEIPTYPGILQNYPNPSSYMTNIPYHISATGNVSLKILDMNGRLITTLVDQQLNAGAYRAEWYVSKYPSGTYQCVLTTSGTSYMKKVFVVK
jgi:hypothetical protein